MAIRTSSWVTCASLLAGGIAIAVCGLAEGAVLRFRKAATVGEGMVRIADVADVEEADSALREKLGAVVLAPAPAEGKSVRIDFELVRSRLTAQGIDVTPIQFSGRSVVPVSRGGEARSGRIIRTVYATDSQRTASVNRVNKAINDYVLAREPKLGQVAAVPSLMAEQVSLLAKTSLGIEVTGGAAPWTGEQTFVLHVGPPQGPRQRLTVACHVSPLARKVQVTRTVRPGQVLAGADVALVPSLEENNDRRMLLENVRDAIGLEALRTLRPGECIAAADLKRVTLVERGKPVTIISRVGPVAVSLVGKSESDGSIGDAVMVSTLDRKQKMSGWVTGYHEVSVNEVEGRGKTESFGSRQPSE